MKNIFSITARAIKQSFSKTGYRILFIAALLVMLFLFTYIPVISVPGNTISTQLDIFKPIDYFLVIFLSLLYALFITMQIYTFRVTKVAAKGISKSVGGGLGTIFAGIASTAFCASCLAPLFGLLGIGFGGIIFVLKYKFYLVALVTILMILAIYSLAKKINKVCSVS